MNCERVLRVSARCLKQSFHSACGRACNFSLLVQRKVTKRKHVKRASHRISCTKALRWDEGSNYNSVAQGRQALRASSRRKRSPGMDVLAEFPAPFAVPSIAGFGEEGPQGRAHDARASAVSTWTCCQTTPPKPRSTGHSDSRTRIGTPRSALAFLVTFWAMPKSNPLGRRPSGSFAFASNPLGRRPSGSFAFASNPLGRRPSGSFNAKSWIPAFAGMTSNGGRPS